MTTQTTSLTESWQNLTLANNFLRPKHSFGRDSLKSRLTTFAGYAVAPYLQASARASAPHRD